MLVSKNAITLLSGELAHNAFVGNQQSKAF
jgi:hypothetical protein